MDAGGYATLSTNQITLPSGTYRCRIQCPAYSVNKHKARLYNITNAAVLLLGSSQRNPAAGNHTVPSIIIGRFKLAATKVLEVQHRCETTLATNGLGVAAGFGSSTCNASPVPGLAPDFNRSSTTAVRPCRLA